MLKTYSPAKEMAEQELQDAIIELATMLGYRVHAERPAVSRSGKWSTPIQGHPGFTDLVLARHGRVIFAECKTEKGQLSGEQYNWQCELEGVPGKWTWKVHPEYYIWRPSDWLSGEVERLLKAGE